MRVQRLPALVPVLVVLLLAPTMFAACGGSSSTSDPLADSASAVASAEDEARFAHARFNGTGNMIISDQFNNRVIEIDLQGNIVWSFGDGSSVAGPTSIVGPNDVERIGEKTLIAGSGAAAGDEPTCIEDCLDNRVIMVDRSGNIVWQYGQAGVKGAGDNELDTPVAATFLPNGHILIADQGNQRIIEVTRERKIVWQQGTTGVAGAGFNELASPNSAELLANGNILIAEQDNHRVSEVSRDHHLVWSYGDPNDTSGAILGNPSFASRLDNGNTLIDDGGDHARVIEVTPDGQVVWEFITNARPGATNTDPSNAVRLRNGHTLITDKENSQVIEVDAAGTIVREIGTVGVAGNGPGQLNKPYDARIVRDFTGITSPRGF
jgi:hypothetical protein